MLWALPFEVFARLLFFSMTSYGDAISVNNHWLQSHIVATWQASNVERLNLRFRG